MAYEHVDIVEGQLVDLHRRSVYGARIRVADGAIASVEHVDSAPGRFILPGFVDAHVHIESSMLTPAQFARLAVVHGTVATVSDPHEIGNVLGVEGVEFMIDDGNRTPFKFYFGAPSCVPATPFETAGATIDCGDVERLLSREDVVYLAEMMNWPGVLNADEVVAEKIRIAHRLKKPVDGHAPGLRGAQAALYAAAGITTDHESFELGEARDKIRAGMKIIIREGSAARNFDELHPLIADSPESVMFCSDDKHPDELVVGHINRLVRRARALGYDMYDVLRAACLNPVEHYGLHVGVLRDGDPADFIIVDSLETFDVQQTVIDGRIVADAGRSCIPDLRSGRPNRFSRERVEATDFELAAEGDTMRVIEALDGQLVTNTINLPVSRAAGLAVADPSADVLKLAVVNRYDHTDPAIAFIRNIGLRRGAIASSVAHDSHNIIAVGVDDESLCAAVNLIITHKGGVSAVDGPAQQVLPLPVAGLMSDGDGYEVAAAYSAIDAMAKDMGSTLRSPFMTLSFMALLVIPELKLSDLGLFDGNKFEFVDVFA
jgi:adenine deaminase